MKVSRQAPSYRRFELGEQGSRVPERRKDGVDEAPHKGVGLPLAVLREAIEVGVD